jgi:hypothetical protein
MIRRAIFPLLCGAALTVATLPGVARVGVFVGVFPPAPVVEVVPAPPAPGSRAIGAGTACSMSGYRASMPWPLFHTRYGCPEGGSDTAPAG